MHMDLRTIAEYPTLSEEVAEQRLDAAQHRLAHLRLFTAGVLPDSEVGPGILVVFEGFDAAGKGGAIRRLANALDPRHVAVVPIGPPTPEEMAHHFLWRFQSHLPARGAMTVFDRSWYGRVLVERVDGLIDDVAVQRSLREITEFETALAASETIIVKFWMHISDDEQLHRFEERRDSPLKQWKLTEADWHNRKKRDQYIEAANEMLAATDSPTAPWHVVLANSKRYARVQVLELLNHEIEAGLIRRGITPPKSRGQDYLA